MGTIPGPAKRGLRDELNTSSKSRTTAHRIASGRPGPVAVFRARGGGEESAETCCVRVRSWSWAYGGMNAVRRSVGCFKPKKKRKRFLSMRKWNE